MVSLKRPSALGILETPSEQRAFQFFIERTSPILSAYFGHSFWSITIPQVSAEQPAIKYVVLSLSAVTEIIDFDSEDPADKEVFQTVHSKAVRSLARSNEPPAIETFLIACLLFACADFIRGERTSGMRHIQAGMNMLDEWYKTKYRIYGDSTAEAQMVLSIAPLYKPYLEKARTYGVAEKLHFESRPLLEGLCELTFVPEIFSCVQEARHVNDGLSHNVSVTIDSGVSDGKTLAFAETVLDLLYKYRIAMENFCSQAAAHTKARYDRILKLLQIHNQSLLMMFNNWWPSNGNHHNSCEDFRSILDLYDEFEDRCRSQSCNTILSDNSLMFHSGYIPPLFLIATSTPDLAIRTRALEHLQRLRVQESNWTSCAAYKIAKTLRAIDERGVTLRCCSRNTAEQYPVYVRQISRDSKDFASIEFACARCRVHTVQYETLLMDISDLKCASKVRWPLDRIVRVGGYQGGVAALPNDCQCFADTSKLPMKESLDVPLRCHFEGMSTDSTSTTYIDSDSDRHR